eukprot:3619055-Prymnesium_polylepis.5
MLGLLAKFQRTHVHTTRVVTCPHVRDPPVKSARQDVSARTYTISYLAIDLSRTRDTSTRFRHPRPLAPLGLRAGPVGERSARLPLHPMA